jgi:uncharacterized heparinase superfamily protein
MSMDWDNIAHVRIHARAAEQRIIDLEAENLRLRAQLTEQAQQIRALEKLTQDDWDEIEDGLEAAEMHAREQAAMWAGRSRAAQYVREADRTLATHNKVKDLLAALQTDPRQP